MGKPTPGPWTAVEFEDGGEVVDADGYEVATLNTGLIAVNRYWLDEHEDHWASHGPASHIERTVEEVDANARLIAASPTMLEAAKEALDAMEAVWEAVMADRHPDLEALNDAMKATRAAIARTEATGTEGAE